MEANKKYQENQNQIKNELTILKDKLNRHKKAYCKDSTNWGYVGDLGHILTQVKELNQFLNE